MAINNTFVNTIIRMEKIITPIAKHTIYMYLLLQSTLLSTIDIYAKNAKASKTKGINT